MSAVSITFLCAVGICLALNGVRAQAPMIPQVLPADKTGAFNMAGTHDKFGTNLQAQVQQRLWQSDNKRHELHGGASYSQHLGGPYGSSRPNMGYGGSYVFRF